MCHCRHPHDATVPSLIQLVVSAFDAPTPTRCRFGRLLLLLPLLRTVPAVRVEALTLDGRCAHALCLDVLTVEGDMKS